MEDPEVQALYGLPLGDFVAARNHLAKAKKKLAPDLAEEIKKLARPTASAWIINQLVRQERKRVDHLLRAIDRVRAVQIAALSGGTELSLREATKEEREAQADLAAAAPAALSAAGASVVPGAIDRAIKALHAAALDSEGRSQLERGCLWLDFEEPGFDGLVTGDLQVPSLDDWPTAGIIDLDGERSRRAEEDSRRRAEDLRAEEERRRTKKKKVEALQAQLETQRGIEVRLKTELQGLERIAAETRRKAEESERLAATGRSKLEEAESKRAELQARLAELQQEDSA